MASKDASTAPDVDISSRRIVCVCVFVYVNEARENGFNTLWSGPASA
jgi:hypothetical protein